MNKQAPTEVGSRTKFILSVLISANGETGSGMTQIARRTGG